MNGSEFLLLRLAAPLMSFGGVKVDEHNFTDRFPGAAMLVGLLGNALGWDHADAHLLTRLQERLRFGARCDRAGSSLVDYHTVDLDQPFLRQTWTTRGRPEGRAGGKAKTATHIRYRHYWADSVVTVALRLEPAEESPLLAHLESALRQPERPLFLGRKACPPSEPLVIGRAQAPTLHAALTATPAHPRADDTGFSACWPQEGEPAPPANQGHLLPIVDERDWANQIHVGRRLVWHGWIPHSGVPNE